MDNPLPAGPADRKASIRVFLCGDVMTGRGIDQILPHPSRAQLYERWARSAKDYLALAECVNGPIPRPAPFTYIWGAALDEWRRARPDVRIINLETSITRSEGYLPKGINYRMNPHNVGCLLTAGIDCCVLANNHVLDWGLAGLLETLATLERHHIRIAGAGRDLQAARSPASLDVPGKGRVLVIAMGSPSSGIPRNWAAGPDRAGINLTDLTEPDVETARRALAPVYRPGDVVIASVHWGPNWGHYIPEDQRRFAHALIDHAGVSVVHGHSSHHPKAVEVYQGRLVLYGCGDFLNDYEGIEGHEAFRGDLALMYFADIDPASGALNRLVMTPLRIRRFQLVRPSDKEADWLRATLDRECAKLGGDVERSSEGLVLRTAAAAR